MQFLATLSALIVGVACDVAGDVVLTPVLEFVIVLGVVVVVVGGAAVVVFCCRCCWCRRCC